MDAPEFTTAYELEALGLGVMGFVGDGVAGAFVGEGVTGAGVGPGVGGLVPTIGERVGLGVTGAGVTGPGVGPGVVGEGVTTGEGVAKVKSTIKSSIDNPCDLDAVV